VILGREDRRDLLLQPEAAAEIRLFHGRMITARARTGEFEIPDVATSGES
jgi:hypothetical protein